MVGGSKFSNNVVITLSEHDKCITYCVLENLTRLLSVLVIVALCTQQTRSGKYATVLHMKCVQNARARQLAKHCCYTTNRWRQAQCHNHVTVIHESILLCVYHVPYIQVQSLLMQYLAYIVLYITHHRVISDT